MLILGIEKPVEQFTGVVIAIAHRSDDVEEKWIVAPEDTRFTMQEIKEKIYFQEKYFDSHIIT